MPIPTYKYFRRFGISGIIRISSEWREESKGYQNEHIDEKIACMDKGKFYMILAHLTTKTMGGEDFRILTKDEISEDEYQAYKKEHGEIIDTDEYRAIYDEIVTIDEEIGELYPSCPKCDSVMVERSSRYGKFWGCSGFPKCKGTKKLGDESEQMKKLHDRQRKLNNELSKLER